MGRKKPKTARTAEEVHRLAEAHMGPLDGRPARASGAHLLRTDAGNPVVPHRWRVSVGHEHVDGDAIFDVDDATGAITVRSEGL